MDYLSEDYFYIIKSAFDSYFWQTFFLSFPSIISLIISVILVFMLLYFSASLFKKIDPEDYYANKNRFGTGILVFMIICAIPFFLILSYVTLPETFLQFNKKHAVNVYNVYSKRNIEQFKEDTGLVLIKLQTGFNGNIFKTTKEYEDFERALLSKTPNKQVVYRKDVAKLLNTSFLKCLEKDNITEIRGSDNNVLSTINLLQINEAILDKNKECLSVSVKETLDNPILLKSE